MQMRERLQMHENVPQRGKRILQLILDEVTDSMPLFHRHVLIDLDMDVDGSGGASSVPVYQTCPPFLRID